MSDDKLRDALREKLLDVFWSGFFDAAVDRFVPWLKLKLLEARLDEARWWKETTHVDLQYRIDQLERELAALPANNDSS